MKEYINKSNQKIVWFAWAIFASSFLPFISSIYYMIQASKFSAGTLFSEIIYQLILLLIILSNRKEKYTFFDDGMLVKRLTSKEVYWERLSEVFISDWYIKITDKKNNMLKILKKVSQEDAFKNITKEIKAHVNSDIVHYDNEEGINDGKNEGGLKLIFAHICLIVLLGISRLYTNTVKLITDFNIDLFFFIYIASAFVTVFVAIQGVKIILNFGKRKAEIIIKIKKYLWLGIGMLILIYLNNFVSTYAVSNLPLLSQILNIISSIIYGTLQFAIALEYLATSERVKHYFVK